MKCVKTSHKLKVALLGNTGFIGSEVCCVLSRHCHLHCYGLGSIIPDDVEYDVVVNCAGISYRFLVQKDPQKYRVVEDDIISKLSRFCSPKIIHISSMAVELQGSEYGKLKEYVEQEVKKIFEQWCILRLAGIIGPELRKNVVFDILHDKKVYVTEDSKFNYIAAYEVGKLISILLNGGAWGSLIKVAAVKGIIAGDIARIAQKSDICWGDEYQDNNDINILKMKEFLVPKSSEEYIEEILRYK